MESVTILLFSSYSPISNFTSDSFTLASIYSFNPAAPSGSAGPTWAEVIAKLRGKVSVGEYNIISDNYHSDGVFRGSELTIYAKNAFAMRMLTAAPLQEKIRSAASELSGGNVKLSVVEGSPAESTPAGNLDLLGKFGNVKFE